MINRDLSIAVLRYFVRQRQKEIAEGVLKAPRPKRTPAEAAQLKQSAGEMQSYLFVHLRRQKHLIVPRKSPHVKGSALQYSQGMLREISQRTSMVIAEGPTPRPKLDDNIRILEGLAASGLRSIRYALEVKPSFNSHGGLQSGSFSCWLKQCRLAQAHCCTRVGMSGGVC